MARDRLIGTYYGLYNLLSGVGILAGNLLAGATLDLARSAGRPSLPWLLLAVAGLASAFAVRRLERRGRLAVADTLSAGS
jgi:MFS-type transporter involved in bile tolerance (Atg22 family)